MAGHGSPPAEDRAEHPGRKVSNVIGTQPRPLPTSRFRGEQPNVVQRVRRERFDTGSG